MATRKLGLKFKLNTATGSLEYAGGHAEGIVTLFTSLGRAERVAMIDTLGAAHLKVCAREDEPRVVRAAGEPT